MSDADRMAAQLARLLTESDGAELAEIVRRWKLTAATAAQRVAMEKMADQILALRAAFEQARVKPTPEELELALRMMLRVAASGDGV
jgi:hypothetical protein